MNVIEIELEGEKDEGAKGTRYLLIVEWKAGPLNARLLLAVYSS